MRAVLFAPHQDDETLFAAYTLLRVRPRVVICYASARAYGRTAARLAESRRAVALLGAGPVDQWMGPDLEAHMRALDHVEAPAVVYAPALDTVHRDHLTVAIAAGVVFGDRVRRYHTYDAAGKVRRGAPVPVEPGWPDLKRRALACYVSQRRHPRARRFYDETQFELDEYMPC